MNFDFQPVTSTPPRELWLVNNEKEKLFYLHTSHTSQTPPTQPEY
ncbi:hypothetical protein [Calothrix rhizosoleniae]|nr:hypothetical protein [Calothrix rhizosoleniae]